MLTPSQIQSWHHDGYLVLPGFKSAGQRADLSARAREIVDAFEPDAQTGVFSTVDPSRTADRALLASASEVHCFFEEEAFDAMGRLRQAKALSINKIGHAMHDRDPVFSRFSRGPDLAAVAAGVGLVEPLIWQSQVIFKQPGIGGEVRWHQDATYFVTTPVTVTTFWFALEDATVDNGCLWVEPGGHRGPLRERFVRSGDQLGLERLDPTPWPTQAGAVPVEVPAGSLVLLQGMLPHYSAPNRSPRSRLAYTLHVTDGRSEYAAGNWLQRDASLPVSGFAQRSV